MMLYFDYISIILAILSGIWGLYILFKKQKAENAFYLSILIFATDFWIVCIAITNLSHSIRGVIFFSQLCTIAAIFAVLSFLFFVTVLRHKTERMFFENRFFIAIFIIFSLFILLTPGDMMIKDIVINENAPPEGKLDLIYSIIFVSIFIIILIRSVKILLSGFNKLNKKVKAQIIYICLGGVLTGAGGLTFDAILPWLLNDERFYSIGPIFFGFFIVFCSYAIIKHQLLDIKVVIQRGIIYSLSLGSIVGLYMVLVFVLGLFFEQLTQERIILSAGITAILGIYGVPVIERYFRRKTDMIFFKDRYDYSRAIYQLSQILNENINSKVIAQEIAVKLRSILRVKSVSFILPDLNLVFNERGEFREPAEDLPFDLFDKLSKESLTYLNCSDIPYLLKQAEEEKKSFEYRQILQAAEHFSKKYNYAVITAVILEKKLIGLITLGKKMSGDMFDKNDENLLKTISHQAAVALEKARLYEEVQSYSQKLEEKVVMRTAKIQGLQEDQKQMMLEIAHGLQTPLTILKNEISGCTEGQEVNTKKVKTIENVIDNTSNFIYNMLRLAKLESSEKFVIKAKINLSVLLDELIESFEVITQEQGIALKYEIEPEINILGEKNEISELIMNMVSNSVKYIGKKKEKKIKITLKQSKEKIRLIVEDNGIGIDKEHLPHLFSRFYRIRDKKHANIQGTGLGLAISKQIAWRHNATIKVESEKDEGTKVIIEFPKIKEETS